MSKQDRSARLVSQGVGICRDIAELKKVQKRRTVRIRGQEHLPYKVRLQPIVLHSWKRRQ